MKSAVPLSLALALSVFLIFANVPQQASAESMRNISSYDPHPLSFEANRGQTDNRVKFLARGNGYTLFLTSDEAVFSLARIKSTEGSATPASAVLRTRFIGANVKPTITGASKLPGTSSYFIGSDSAKWRVGVPTYGRVRYTDLYPGIDLIYYGKDGQLEYDLVLAAGSDPHRIRLAIAGADRLNIGNDGDLAVSVGNNQVTMRKPFVYQEVNGVKHMVRADYVLLSKDEIGIQLGSYDSSKSLVIDPALVYSGYLGGTGSDAGLYAAVDSKGNLYVMGDTTSTDFPITSGVVQSIFAGVQDVFVAKINSKGTALVWSTYLGGNDNDVGWSISVDKSANVYLAGETKSTNFPVTAGAFQTVLKGTKDGFIAKLNSTGTTLIYSTYLGGSGKQSIPALALDSSGSAYVTGTTQSPDFPVTAGAFQTKCTPCGLGGSNAFITKLDPTGKTLSYSTFLGGSAGDVGTSIVVDSSNNAYLTGETVDRDFPLLNPIQQTFAGGGISCASGNGAGGFGPCGDAFVTKINASGSALVYSTYLGGSGEDGGFVITVDSTGAAYVAGGTDSTNFPTTAGAFQTAFGGGANGCANNGFSCGDAFVAKISSAGALTFSTYLGGKNDDVVFHALKVDSSKNVHMAGNTNSSNFPVTANATQPTYGGGTSPCPTNATCGDAFQAILNSSGSSLLYSTYLGGSGDDAAAGIALDSSGYDYLVGVTTSSSFPIVGKPFQNTCKSCASGIPDAFVTKMGPSADLKLTNSAPGSVKSGSTLTYTIVVDNLGPDAASSVTITDNTPVGTTFNSVTITTGKCTSPAPGSTGSVKCSLNNLAAGASVTETLVVNVTAPSGSTITDKATAKAKTFDPNTKNNSATVKTSVT